MTDGIQGVNYYSGDGEMRIPEGTEMRIPEGTEMSIPEKNMNNDKQTDGTKKTSSGGENELVSLDFESMSYEEVVAAVGKLQERITALSGQLDAIKTIIESDEKLKEMFEKQYEEIKKQFEQAQEEFLNCDDPNEQLFLNDKVTNLSNLMNELSNQVMQALNKLQEDAVQQSAISSELMKTQAAYTEGVSVASEKAAEIARQQAEAAMQTAASPAPETYTSGDQAADGANFFTSSPSSGGVSSGHVSQNMLNSLKNWEGLRTTAYKCPAGVWTIGYGHTSGVQPGQQISEAQAEQFLKQDLASFENEVAAQAKAAGVTLTQGQFDALVSFAYNCGGGALQNSGIMGMLKSGNTQAAASKLKEYVHGGGQVLPGLVSRRNVEAGWLMA